MSSILLTSIIVFLTAFFLCLILTPYIRRLSLKEGYVDHPSERKIHRTPIPILGGIPLYFGIMTALLLIQPFTREFIGFFIGGTILFLIGMIDDMHHIRPFFKLIFQVIAAAIAVYFGNLISFFQLPFTDSLFLLGDMSYIVSVGWIVLITNTINLADGIDGLAAGVSAITAGILSIIALLTGEMDAAFLTIAIFGSTLAFLRFNFHPAQIFMGDGGSLFLGFSLAVASITGVLKSAISLSLLVPILIFGVPIFDLVLSIFRRMKNGQSIFSADIDHVHHKLLRRGMSQVQVAISIYLLSLLLGILALVLSIPSL